MKRWLISLVIREMKIKTKVRYCYTSFKMAKIKTTDHIKCWPGQEAEGLELSYTAGRGTKGYDRFGKQCGSVL